MNEEQIWRGKGPITYEINIYDLNEELKHPKPDRYVGAGWKYQIWISGAGDYKDCYLGNDSESFGFFADTKDGVIRDLALYITSQQLNPRTRAELEIPLKPLSLNNVDIYDKTDNHDFHGIDVRTIFANAKALSQALPPPGERPFIATIRDNEDSPGHYDIYTVALDSTVAEEWGNPWQYDTGGNIFDDISAQNVNKTIKEQLSKEKLEYDDDDDDQNIIKPTINNTKLINYTDNPEFNLKRIFTTVTPLQVIRTRPALKLTRRVSNVATTVPSITIPTMAKEAKEEIVKIEKEAEKKMHKEKKRLPA